MNVWRRWVRQPQKLWLRRAIFQVHLWTGLAIGLYIVMLSVTGSALVYRVELNTAFRVPRPTFDAARTQLSADALTAAAERAYPGWDVKRVDTRISPRDPIIDVRLERAGERKDRLFDPYTGADLGDAVPAGTRALNWLASLHDQLLLGQPGRQINGAGSAVITLLLLSGAILWWPGIKSWRRSLVVKRRSGWVRVNWDLHSAMGAWFFLVLALWGLSGVYLSYPLPVTDLVDRVLGSEDIIGKRPSDTLFFWLARLHFGRFRDAPYLQPLWVVVGLVPAVMFITGALMWWNRVLRKRPGKPSQAMSQNEREVA